MRYFDDNRRRLSKKHVTAGVKKSIWKNDNTIIASQNSSTSFDRMAFYGSKKIKKRINFFNTDLLGTPTSGSAYMENVNGYPYWHIKAGTLYTGELLEVLKEFLNYSSTMMTKNCPDYYSTYTFGINFVNKDLETLVQVRFQQTPTRYVLNEDKVTKIREAYGIVFAIDCIINNAFVGEEADLVSNISSSLCQGFICMPDTFDVSTNQIGLKINGYNLLNERMLLKRNEKGSKITITPSGAYQFDSYPCTAHSSEFYGVAFLEEFKRCVKAGKTYTIVGIFTSVGPGAAGYFYLKSAPGGGETIFSFTNNYDQNKIALKVFSLTQEQLDATNNIWIYGTSQANLDKGAKPTIGNFMILEGEYTIESLPRYEPYVPSREIIIPNEINLDGTIIPLNFGRIDNLYDTLVIDNVNKTVLYKMQIVEKELTGGEQWNTNAYGYQKFGELYYQCNVGNKLVNNKGFCNRFPHKTWINQDNYTYYTAGTYLIFRTEGTESLTYWLQMIRQDAQLGIPLKAIYALEKPIVYDLSQTELGKQLLDIKLHSNTVIISALGENGANPDRIELEYYTTNVKEGDMQELTVECVDEQGNVMDAKYRLIRKDSLYKAEAPKIEGYEPLNEALIGVASENSKIEFVYKEKIDDSI